MRKSKKAKYLSGFFTFAGLLDYNFFQEKMKKNLLFCFQCVILVGLGVLVFNKIFTLRVNFKGNMVFSYFFMNEKYTVFCDIILTGGIAAPPLHCQS